MSMHAQDLLSRGRGSEQSCPLQEALLSQPLRSQHIGVEEDRLLGTARRIETSHSVNVPVRSTQRRLPNL